MSAADDLIRSHDSLTYLRLRYWSVDEFRARKDDAKPVIDGRCGWDITDYGVGQFDTMGLFPFTLRNGRLSDLEGGRGMCYAESCC